MSLLLPGARALASSGRGCGRSGMGLPSVRLLSSHNYAAPHSDGWALLDGGSCSQSHTRPALAWKWVPVVLCTPSAWVSCQDTDAFGLPATVLTPVGWLFRGFREVPSLHGAPWVSWWVMHCCGHCIPMPHPPLGACGMVSQQGRGGLEGIPHFLRWMPCQEIPDGPWGGGAGASWVPWARSEPRDTCTDPHQLPGVTVSGRGTHGVLRSPPLQGSAILAAPGLGGSRCPQSGLGVAQFTQVVSDPERRVTRMSGRACLGGTVDRRPGAHGDRDCRQPARCPRRLDRRPGAQGDYREPARCPRLADDGGTRPDISPQAGRRPRPH